MTGKCPYNYEACQTNIGVDNIVCVEKNPFRTIKERCPIVELEILKKTDHPEWVTELTPVGRVAYQKAIDEAE